MTSPLAKLAADRAAILRLESVLRALPQAEFPLKHYRIPGVYIREMAIPAGSVLTGKIHKHPCVTVILRGEIELVSEFGRDRLKAPWVQVTAAGTKRAGHACTDTLMLTIHRTDAEGLAAIEQDLVCETFAEYERFLELGKPTMTDADIEQIIQDRRLTAPRVKPEDIEGAIAGEYYFTAAEGQIGRGCDLDALPESDRARLRVNTFCLLVLRNGFSVFGHSACVSPENFDAELGARIAREEAVGKLWPLLGYALADRLNGGAAP